MVTNLAYPFRITGSGQVGTADHAAHVRQMVEQVLMTIPGERVNRPDFGCGLQLVLFEGMNSQLLAATQTMVHASLSRWLGDLIQVEGVALRVQETRLIVTVQYVILSTRERQTEVFEQ